MMSFIFLGCLILILAVIFRLNIRYKAKKATAYLKKFEFDSELNHYVAACPRMNLNGHQEKCPDAVLLLHGFATSPEELKILYPELTELNLPYYAPVFTGSGLGCLKLFRTLTPSDWLRDAIHAYDLLSSRADNIHIVAHSTGAAIALHLSQKRKVKQLIFTGPNLVVGSHNHWNKKLLHHPICSLLLQWLFPFYIKPIKAGRIISVDTRDPQSALKRFYYPCLTLQAIATVFHICESLDVQKGFNFEQLTILYGKQDKTVSIPEALALLDHYSIPYQAFAFENSGHNVLEDYDREEVSKKVLEVLTEATSKSIAKRT